jgi:cytochrome P450
VSRATVGSAPGALPLLGHAPKLLRDPCGFLASLPAYGDLVYIRLGPQKALAVCDPELTHEVLVDDRTYDKGGQLVDRGRELFGDSLAICPYHKHRRQRRLVQPAFSRARMSTYAAIMTERIAAMMQTWQNGDLDVRAELRAFTSGVTVKTMFGAMLSAADQQQALDDLSVMLVGTAMRMFLPPTLARLPVPGNRSYERARVRLRGTLGSLIADYRDSGTDHGDALSMLLSAAGDEDRPLSDEEIIDQIIILFVGGSDTTANTLCWALVELCRHPEVLARLHAEVDEVLAGRTATFEDLHRLEFTRHVITETLRLYPPVSMVTRVVTADAELGGHRIPAGSTVVYSSMAVQRRADVYPDAEQFVPARWAGPDASNLPRGALIPFGEGARKCIGDAFGMTMASLALASIAGRWTFELPDGEGVQPVLRVFLAPRNLRLRIRSRTATDAASDASPA